MNQIILAASGMPCGVVVLIAIGVGIATWVTLQNYEESKFKEKKNKLEKHNVKIERESKKRLEDGEEALRNSKQLVEDLKKESSEFPPLAKALVTYISQWDDQIWKHLKSKPRPALKTAQELKKANREKRNALKLLNQMQNRLEVYEFLAPWLTDYVDLPSEELLQSLVEEETHREPSEGNKNDYESDPISRFVPKSEYQKLDDTTRNQLALDRYCNSNRKLTPWAIGIQFERYIGWRYEEDGWRVEYTGALKGKEDHGIDLICKKNAEVHIVQCKRLSAIKEIPVRENVVAQTFGAAMVYELKNKIQFEKIKPVIITTYELSDDAKDFANVLKVKAEENVEIGSYPMIKCNINKSGEKIYHLPMDQQYDKTVIEIDKGEKYVATVQEAEELGFRRAFRWRGEKSN